MILDLIGEKMLSNQLLTNQEVGGALVPNDAGDILQVAVNRLLKGVKPKHVQGIFAAQNAMTASPLSSPTTESPEIQPKLTWMEWMTLHPQAVHRCKGGGKISQNSKCLCHSDLNPKTLSNKTGSSLFHLRTFKPEVHVRGAYKNTI